VTGKRKEERGKRKEERGKSGPSGIGRLFLLVRSAGYGQAQVANVPFLDGREWWGG
jgi:hypothetical protein